MTDAVSSQSLMEETIATKRQRLTTSTGTLTSPSPSLSSSFDTPGPPPVTYIPFDLVAEILCRLPVKFLLQLRSVCKSWNTLISDDPKFATKHLRVSTTRHHLVGFSSIPSREINVISYPLHSVFTTVTMNATQLEYPPLNNPFNLLVGSCDGVLCFAIDQRASFLWNPCIKKIKKLPYLEIPQKDGHTIYDFGYDPLTDNYKVVAVLCNKYDTSSSIKVSETQVKACKTQVKVHTLGTDSWRMIQDFPSMAPMSSAGKFVSGTVNWLASIDLTNFSCSCFIISLSLGKESYQEILQPDYGGVNKVTLTLGVLKDCLCIFAHSNSFNDVWLMKEYGNTESWTKLISVPPYVGDHVGFYFYKVVYIYDEDQVLLEMEELFNFQTRLVVYNSKNDTFKVPEIQDISGWMTPKIYVESLISPCF